MRLYLIIATLIFTAGSFSFCTNGQTPKAVKGVIDLRQIADKEKFVIKLNGEWEFYWKKMLRPYDFIKGRKPEPDYYGRVPSYWTDYPEEKVKTEKYGYATYRLTILLPSGLQKLMAIDVPVFDSSYDLYLNGEYMDGNGTPGKSASETKPDYRRKFIRFTPSSDTITIVINVSNFDHRRGGFWLPMKFGTLSEVQKQLESSWAGDWATISLLLGFSLFFLFFFILYPKDRIMAFFSMAVIGLALRPLFTSHFLILNIINISWIWLIRFEYLDLFLIMIGWTWFVVNLYPTKLIRAIAWTITTVFSLAFFLTLFFPVKIFSYTTLPYYPSMLILLIYALYYSFAGFLRKSVMDSAYFFAFLILSFGAIHDIKVSLGKADSSIGYILSFIVVAFIFIQAALLLYRWVKAFYEKEKLHDELEFMNRSLEQLVSIRTQELKIRNEEIEKQNNKIALQNKQLSETIQLKNKIFSVIAHDLRSPVVNILYMLNLLKEEEYKEKYDTFANSCIQYSQMIITLLENMLVWGRGQEDKIKYSPGKRDLADIILTNLSIYKETADRKDISINFTQMGSPIAFFDKDLIDIVIRNLLSNAIKYTKRGGRISILVKDKSNNGEGVMIKICDNGIGIPQTRQSYLFTFTEIDSTPGTENEKGTGLGLKLCNELVKINKGSISVESKEGEGACFTIILPEV
jgi:signal transduction histidine kinase